MWYNKHKLYGIRSFLPYLKNPSTCSYTKSDDLVNKTNLVYKLFLVYLSISTCFGLLWAHHQEKQLCFCDTWYLLFSVDDCLVCTRLHTRQVCFSGYLNDPPFCSWEKVLVPIKWEAMWATQYVWTFKINFSYWDSILEASSPKICRYTDGTILTYSFTIADKIRHKSARYELRSPHRSCSSHTNITYCKIGITALRTLCLGSNQSLR